MSKPTLIFQAPLFSRSGYGDHARDLFRSLIDIDKFDLRVVITSWGDCPNIIYPEFQKYQPKKDEKLNPEIFMQLSVPNEFQRVAKYNIGITAGIETNISPGEWLEGCNSMDLVIVPSQHSKQVFLNTVYDKMDNNTRQKIGEVRVERPIEVLFEGLNNDIWKKTDNISDKIDDIFSDVKEEFCFLFTGHWIQGDLGHDRKDVGGMIKTFIETFKNTSVNKRPAMILKTSGATFSELDKAEIIRKIKNITQTYNFDIPNIYLIHGELTSSEMNSLYNHPKVKAMVSFTHGEGYGRPLAEFAVTQKPIIASNWSGQVDFLTHSVKLSGELKSVHPSAANNMILKEGKWFYVDYSQASSMLKSVFKKYKMFIPDARKQARIVREDFSLNEMTKKFSLILDNYLPKFAKKIKLNIPKLEKIDD